MRCPQSQKALRAVLPTLALALTVPACGGVADSIEHADSMGTVEQQLDIDIGSSVGSQLGAYTTHYLPNRWLRLIFSGLVAATVVMIAWNLVRLLTHGAG